MNKGLRNFKGIKSHLDAHCTGHLSGAIPTEFLTQNSYTQCRVCDKVVHTKFQGICVKCRPNARRREQFYSLRRGNNISGTTNASSTTPNLGQQINNHQQTNDLPSLSEIHKRFVPTIKSIPLILRRLWAQCLVRTLAQAVWTNREADWLVLQMLVKCTLCQPVDGGKSHSSQRLAWTRGRLQRWLAGERSSLWQDLPQYGHSKHKELSGKVAKRQQQERCIELTSEGGYSNACKALISAPPLSQTAEATAKLREKHPSSNQPIDLNTFGNASSALVPHINSDLVE